MTKTSNLSSSTPSLSSVQFHGDTIYCVEKDGQPFVPLRPIIENLGLDWSGQTAKLRANKERWNVENISTVAEDGMKREMVCIPVCKFAGFLAGLNPKKVKPELRDKVILYQNESDNVLWNYWFGGKKRQPRREMTYDEVQEYYATHPVHPQEAKNLFTRALREDIMNIDNYLERMCHDLQIYSGVYYSTSDIDDVLKSPQFKFERKLLYSALDMVKALTNIIGAMQDAKVAMGSIEEPLLPTNIDSSKHFEEF